MCSCMIKSRYYRLHVAFPIKDGLQDASFAFAKAESLRKSVVIDVAALLLLPKQSFIRIKVVGKGHILGRELV